MSPLYLPYISPTSPLYLPAQVSFYIKSALSTLPKLLGSLDLLGGQGLGLG